MFSYNLKLTESEAIWLLRLMGSLNSAGESTEPLDRIYNRLADKVQPHVDGYVHDLKPLDWDIVDHAFNGGVLIRFEGITNDS